MKKALLFRLAVLLAAMMCALGAAAAEAYACYTPSNTTLTFYYDNQRSSRTGTTYDLNEGDNYTEWETDGINGSVTKVVFDPSFADARPTTTFDWFHDMTNLESITGMEYLNTSEVTDMAWMFNHCNDLTSLDLSNFNTSNVDRMTCMFYGCWSTAAVTYSSDMFTNCTSLVGGQGTTYDANHIDKAYAHIDGGTSNPGYFTAKGPEAYACYTSSNTTLTFYYDKLRSSRTGTTYDLNEGDNYTEWDTDGINGSVTKVVFDPSFAGARPTTTSGWFYGMTNLQSITGLNYLNTSEVTDMSWMFNHCNDLTSLDLSNFNTSNVDRMTCMFYGCCCTSLVGGQGTAYNSSNPKDKTYAHIDGGTSNPGYFTDKNASLRGDVNGDGSVNISDVTALIDYLLSGNPSGVNVTAADCNQDSSVNISDVTALIDYLLSGRW